MLANYFHLQMQNHPLQKDFKYQYHRLLDLSHLFWAKFGNQATEDHFKYFEEILLFSLGKPIYYSELDESLVPQHIWFYNKIAISTTYDLDVICVNIYAHNSFDRFGNEWFEAFKQFVDFIETKVSGIQ